MWKTATVHVHFPCLHFEKRRVTGLFTHDSYLWSQNESKLLPNFYSEMQGYHKVKKYLM